MLIDERSELLEVRLADVDALSHFNLLRGARCPPQAKAGRRRVTGGPWIVTIGNRGWPATARDPARIVLSFTRRLGRLVSRRRGAISSQSSARVRAHHVLLRRAHRPGELVAEVAVNSARTSGEPMRVTSCADDVVNRFLLLDHEPVCDEAPVAAPRYRFRAHHRDAPAPREREQPAHAAAEFWRAHVVCVVAKARVAPAWARPRILRFRPPACQLRDRLILDTNFGESSSERRLGEVRESARGAQLAYVGEQGDTILSKQCDELRERARGVSDDQDARSCLTAFRALFSRHQDGAARRAARMSRWDQPYMTTPTTMATSSRIQPMQAR